MLDFASLDKYRENNRLEAKRAQGGFPHSLWETYSAFANTYGGIILLGVAEAKDKSLYSVPLPDPEQLVRELWAGVNDRNITNVNILTDRDVQIMESGGNRIVMIEVPRADRHVKPVYIGKDPFCGTYRRNGEGDYRCTTEEVRAMLRDQSDLSADARILESMTPENLDRDSVRRYQQRMAKLHPDRSWPELEDSEVLQRIGATARDEQGALHPTAAGLLMFGREKDILREFPNYFLEYQERGADSADRLVSGSGDWSGNLYDFFSRVSRRIAQGTQTDSESLRDALREALANALVHADYHDRRGLVVQKTPTAIQIANPGTFRVNVQQAMKGGVSDPRNTFLSEMFRLIHIGAQNGGLPGICAAWREQGLEPPTIRQSFGPDRTVLILPVSAARKADDGEKRRRDAAERDKAGILEYLTDHVAATADTMAAALDLSPSRTQRCLDELLQEGAVVVQQTDGQYRLRS